MRWELIRQISRFEPVTDVFSKLGTPLFKLENRSVYYMGEGFFISFTERRFRIENNERVEYGEVGEFAFSVYFFMSRREAELFFKLKNGLSNELDMLGGKFGVLGSEISIGSTFEEVVKVLNAESKSAHYQDGETRSLRDGSFQFQNLYIHWGSYSFFFFGKSTTTRLSGVQFVFQEYLASKTSTGSGSGSTAAGTGEAYNGKKDMQ